MSEPKEKVTGAQLAQQSAEELQRSLGQRVEELRKMRFKHALNQLPKTHALGALRRQVAQIKTALTAQAARRVQTP